MGIGVKQSIEASNICTKDYWAAERQQTPYCWTKRTNYHDFHTKTKPYFRKRITAQLPATILIWFVIILVTISLTAMITVVNGDTDVGGGGRNNRISPISIYTGIAANSGNNVHNYRQFSVYRSDSDINVNSDNDLDVEDMGDDEEEELEDESNIIDGRLSTADIDKLHAIVMQGLRLTRIPDVANVSIFIMI